MSRAVSLQRGARGQANRGACMLVREHTHAPTHKTYRHAPNCQCEARLKRAKPHRHSRQSERPLNCVANNYTHTLTHTRKSTQDTTHTQVAARTQASQVRAPSQWRHRQAAAAPCRVCGLDPGCQEVKRRGRGQGEGVGGQQRRLPGSGEGGRVWVA